MKRRIKLSASCKDCSYEEQEKCTKAFMKCNHSHFTHCNSDDCDLLKNLGL